VIPPDLKAESIAAASFRSFAGRKSSGKITTGKPLSIFCVQDIFKEAMGCNLYQTFAFVKSFGKWVVTQFGREDASESAIYRFFGHPAVEAQRLSERPRREFCRCSGARRRRVEKEV